MRYSRSLILVFATLVSVPASSAHAQLLKRTWVSSSGADANPCTRPAPCATFAGAYAKTDVGGEIDVADAGSYGIVAITKSITINGAGLATISVPNTAYGITVRAGTSDVVVIRNLAINGLSGGYRGISFAAGRQLVVENVRILDFLTDGVVMSSEFPTPPPQNLVITKSAISAGFNANGIRVNDGIATISHSVISDNGRTAVTAIGTGIINLDSNVLSGNGVAVQAGFGSGVSTAAIIRLSNNDFYGNLTAFGCGEGSLLSAGNNRKGNNTGGSSPTCAPTGAITQQ